MYIDEDTIRLFNPTYNCKVETQDLQQEYRIGPTSAPPNFTPTQPQSQQFGAAPLSIDSGAIRPCIYRFVYIWPKRGNGFWAWLTFVGPRSVAGFRWNRNTWRYFGMDLRDIRSFQCL